MAASSDDGSFFSFPDEDILDGADDPRADASGAVRAHNAGYRPRRAPRPDLAPVDSLVRAAALDKKDDDAYYAVRQARSLAKQTRTKKRTHVRSGGDGVRHSANAKVSEFTAWLVKTFALESKSTGYACMSCGLTQPRSEDLFAASAFSVVDVAGGRGQLAFNLAAFFSVPVSVIDPASMNVSRFEGQFAKKQAAVRRIKLAEAEAAAAQEESKAAEDPAEAKPTCALCSRPIVPVVAPAAGAVPSSPSAGDSFLSPVAWLAHLRHFQCMMPDSIAVSLHKNHTRPKTRREESSDEEQEEDDFEHIDCDGEDSSAAASSSVTHAPAAASSSSLATQQLHDTLSRASLIYGMHSDGATEALVDYALAHDKDFAVVPCCVFPSAAPHRRVKRSLVQRSLQKQFSRAGETDAALAAAAAASASSDSLAAAAPISPDDMVPVRSYEEFLAYLQAKDASIERVSLPFDGRNCVLYRARNSKAAAGDAHAEPKQDQPSLPQPSHAPIAAAAAPAIVPQQAAAVPNQPGASGESAAWKQWVWFRDAALIFGVPVAAAYWAWHYPSVAGFISSLVYTAPTPALYASLPLWGPFALVAFVSLLAGVGAPKVWRRMPVKSKTTVRALFVAATLPSILLAGAWTGFSVATVAVSWLTLTSACWYLQGPPPRELTWQEQWGSSHQDDDLLGPEYEEEARLEFERLTELHAAEDALLAERLRNPPPPGPLSDDLATALSLSGCGLSRSGSETIAVMLCAAAMCGWPSWQFAASITIACSGVHAVLSASQEQEQMPLWKASLQSIDRMIHWFPPIAAGVIGGGLALAVPFHAMRWGGLRVWNAMF